MSITTFNYLEAILWIGIALTVAILPISGSHYAPYKRVLFSASALLVIFAISDVIEAHTGAWWQPIELLLVKSFCVVGLLLCVRSYLSIRREET